MGRYNVIDLFAGCGGFSVGFEQAGFNIVKAVEFDKQIAQTYLHNHKETKLYIDDIARVDTDEFFERGESDVIIGGPPCQAYSVAGRARMGNPVEEDPRNELYKYYVQFLERYQPKMFVFENVLGIITAKRGEPFADLKKLVDELGYGSRWSDVKGFKFLQKRICLMKMRLIIINEIFLLC